MNNNLKNTLIKTIAAAGVAGTLSACGGSSSKPVPIVEPPVEPPVVVGKTLEEVVDTFNTSGGLNLTRDVSGKTSWTSGADVIDNAFSFSVENSNGSKVCVAYAGQDDNSDSSRDFTFNSIGCDKELVVGGKADFDNVMSNFNGYSAGAFVSAPAAGSYDIYDGSEVSVKFNNSDVSVCTDSVTGSSDNVYTSYDTDSGMTNISVVPGVYADETFAGEEFTIDCDVVGTDGNTSSFSEVAKFDVTFSSVPADRLVDIIVSESGSTLVGRNVETKFGDETVICEGVADNSYGTRMCIDVGNDNNVLSKSDISVNSEGIDYRVAGVNYSNVSDVSSDLTSRLGTIVSNGDITKSYALFFNDAGSKADFYIRNSEMNDSTCIFDSPEDNQDGFIFDCLATGETDSLGFNKYEVSPVIPGYYSNGFEDASGNYSIGTLNFNAVNSNTGNSVEIENVISIEGNVNDDKINFPHLFP